MRAKVSFFIVGGQEKDVLKGRLVNYCDNQIVDMGCPSIKDASLWYLDVSSSTNI